MKKKILSIIGIITCSIVIFTGCSNAGMFVRKKTVVSNEKSIEDKNNTQNNTRVVQRKEVEEQSFDVKLEPLGEVRFISYEPDKNDAKEIMADATFKVEKKSDGTLQVLDGIYDNDICKDEYFNKVEAVSFVDYNNDGYDDIIVICSYSSADDSKLIHSEAKLYSGSTNGKFTLEKQMSEDATSALDEITISSVLSFIGADRKDIVSKDDSWKQAYISAINSDPNLQYRDGYELIHIDNDDIPEIAIIGNCEAAGCVILNYSDGQVYETQLSRLNFTYIERKNLLCNSDGHIDIYYDIVYSIIDGKLTQIAKGDYGAEDNLNVKFDESGEPVYQYKWNGNIVPKEEYIKLLNEVYDTTAAKAGYEYGKWDSYDKIIAEIQNY